MNFIVIQGGDAYKKRKRTFRACDRCKRRRIRCELSHDASSCLVCIQAGVQCMFDRDTSGDSHVSTLTPTQDSERIYESVINAQENGNSKSQFACATQPLAALLSKDPLMSVDGETLGFYLPWKDPAATVAETDPDLQNYLKAKGAFNIPPFKTQKRLISLFFENLYPIFPVIDRSIEKDHTKLPPLLLNAIMLAACRYDTTIQNIRAFAKDLHKRCDLLIQVEQDKVVLIQSCLLMSIDEEGPQGMNISSELIWKAAYLCIELALQIADTTSPHGSVAEQRRAALSRIFWCSFCCDRLNAITSGRALVYNTVDFVKNKPSRQDFELEMDFTIFNDWYELQCLNERIVIACYRPPMGRRKDEMLEKDLASWLPSSPQPSQLYDFLKFSHTSSMLLYFRTKINSVTFIENPRGKDLATVMTCCEGILSYVPTTHHVSVINAILHTITIHYIDLLIGNSSSAKLEFQKCLMKLNILSQFWWLSASSVHLCKKLEERMLRQEQVLVNLIESTATLNDIDLISVIFPNQAAALMNCLPNQ